MNQMVEKQAPPRRENDNTITVPKYKPEQIHEMIYGDLEPEQERVQIDFEQMVSMQDYLRGMKEDDGIHPELLRAAQSIPTQAEVLAKSRPVDSTTDDDYAPLEMDPEDEA